MERVEYAHVAKGSRFGCVLLRLGTLNLMELQLLLQFRLGINIELVALALAFFSRISCHLQFALVCVLDLLVFAAPNSP